MELAAVIDAGEPFVKATYILEGDGLLVFSVSSTLQAPSTAAAQRNYPNVAAQAHALAASAEAKQLFSNMPVHAPGIGCFVLSAKA